MPRESVEKLMHLFYEILPTNLWGIEKSNGLHFHAHRIAKGFFVFLHLCSFIHPLPSKNRKMQHSKLVHSVDRSTARNARM